MCVVVLVVLVVGARDRILRILMVSIDMIFEWEKNPKSRRVIKGRGQKGGSYLQVPVVLYTESVFSTNRNHMHIYFKNKFSQGRGISVYQFSMITNEWFQHLTVIGNSSH